MRVLVTGAAGFIGSNVCDRLIADGHTVFGVDDLSRGTLSNIEDAARGGSFDFERFDVTDPGFPALVARVAPESVCHLAAQIDVRVSVADPLLDARLNLLGTINALEASSRRPAVRSTGLPPPCPWTNPSRCPRSRSMRRARRPASCI